MTFSEQLDLDNIIEYIEEEFLKDLPIFEEIIQYAKNNAYHKIDDLTSLDEDIYMVFDYLNERVSNTNVMQLDMKDLSKVVELYDALLSTFTEDEEYSTFITAKMSLLFKMRKNDLAEECMLSYIRNNPNDGNAYLELMFAFDAIAHDSESAIYYGNLALENENISDREAIEDFLSDLE